MEYDSIIDAFNIFKKYPHHQWVAAEHERILAGPEPSIVSEADIAALTVLGWHADDEESCFYSFV